MIAMARTITGQSGSPKNATVKSLKPLKPKRNVPIPSRRAAFPS
jgi:hypothetical protein